MLLLLLILVISGCAPKMGKIYAMNEKESQSTAKIFIMRNSNPMGSGVRLYPTVNEQKVVGLYSNNYTHFNLKEGKYTFGLLFPDVVFGRWIKENNILKEIKAKKKYYFLLSPTFLGGMEIEEIEKLEAEERISSDVFIKTGKLSKEPNNVVKYVVEPLSNMMGLDEDDENVLVGE